MSGLRLWMSIVQQKLNEAWGQDGYRSQSYTPPTRKFYHGTSEAAWEDIQASDSLNSGKRRGISFTTSERVAREFARMKAGSDYCDKGVVIEFDGDKLCRDVEVVPYRDRHVAGIWHVKDEKEMKAMVRSIPDISAYILSHDMIDAEGHDEPMGF